MTPDRAKFLADIRIVPPLNEKEVLNRLECLMQKRCEVYNGGLAFVPEITNYRMPVETGPENQWLHRLKGFIGDDAGETGINYFTDASILLTAWPDSPALLFGPGEPQMCHKPMNMWRYPSIWRQFGSWKNFAGTLLNNKLMI